VTPVDQTAEGEWGDCLRACVASVLDLPSDEVPDFVGEHGPRWFTALQTWLGHLGKHVAYISTASSLSSIATVYPYDLFWIAVGDGPRGRRHAVVCQSNRVVHDPHPSRSGLQPLEDAIIILPQ